MSNYLFIRMHYLCVFKAISNTENEDSGRYILFLFLTYTVRLVLIRFDVFLGFSIVRVSPSLYGSWGWGGSGTLLRCYVERKVGRAAGRPSSGGGTRRERRTREEPVAERGAEDERCDVAQRPAKTTKIVSKWTPWPIRRRGIKKALKMGKKLRVIHHL